MDTFSESDFEEAMDDWRERVRGKIKKIRAKIDDKTKLCSEIYDIEQKDLDLFVKFCNNVLDLVYVEQEKDMVQKEMYAARTAINSLISEFIIEHCRPENEKKS